MAPGTETAALDFLAFVNASPTPFHAVRSAKQRLVEAGFKEIKVLPSHIAVLRLESLTGD